MTPELVQLVNPDGATIGQAEKLAVHRGEGALHRAVSVFLVDGTSRALLQRRAPSKYHFAGLWANACCTHPGPDESTEQAATRALQNELGIAPSIFEVGTLIYEARDPRSGLIEREYDHVFVGVWNHALKVSSTETEAIEWLPAKYVRLRFEEQPETIAPWFPLVVDRVCRHSVAPHAATPSEVLTFCRAFEA